jgi:hypothetical protein
MEDGSPAIETEMPLGYEIGRLSLSVAAAMSAEAKMAPPMAIKRT